MKMRGRASVIGMCLLTLAALSTSTILAQTAGAVPEEANEQVERAREAANVLSDLTGIAEDGIPNDLLNRAQGIAVIPNVVKGAFGFGGRWGKGLMSRRMANGQWSMPTYVDIRGGSIGFQIGVQATDLVLIFNDADGVKGILDGKLKLGADASVAAGPVGRKAEVGTDVLLESAIFSYSRSKGLFAGVSLDGSTLTIDDSGNRKAYGKDVSGEDILLNDRVETNAVVQPFMDALRKFTPGTT